MNSSSWILMLDANKSTVETNRNFSTINSKSCLFKIHSVLNSWCLDFLPASILGTPGIWVAESQLLLEIIQCYISCTTWSSTTALYLVYNIISEDWVLPILFISATAQVLSSWSRMREFLTLSHNNLNPYSAAINSKVLMWSLLLFQVKLTPSPSIFITGSPSKNWSIFVDCSRRIVSDKRSKTWWYA